VAWLLCRPAEDLNDEDRRYLGRLFELSPEIGQAQSLSQKFIRLMRERRSEDFDAWLGEAGRSDIAEMKAFILGAGATCNGHPVRVSEVSELRRALIGTGFPHDRSNVTPAIERVRRLVTECLDIRRAGSPALDIAWVAAGRLDAHSESLAPWDIAAAGLIATEAGAVRGNLWPAVSSLPPLLRGEGFIVATPGIFEQLYKLLISQ
jgi:myo-inositol-1(or 4)-monophosphatase